MDKTTHYNHLDLNLLIAFDALMAEKNMSKVVEKLFVGQSAMSHSHNRLRQTLNDRITTGMKPTTRAEALIIPIRKALLDIELILLAALSMRIREFAPGVNETARSLSPSGFGKE